MYDHHMVYETAASIMFAGKKGVREREIWDFDVWSREQMMTSQNAWNNFENRLKIDAVQQLIFTPFRYFCDDSHNWTFQPKNKHHSREH